MILIDNFHVIMKPVKTDNKYNFKRAGIMTIIKFKYTFILSVVILFLPLNINSQTESGDFKNAYNSKNYTKSLELINAKLNEYYLKKVEDRRIPEQMISILNVGEKTDLIELFRKRREKGFLIEDNPEMAELHLYAARSLSALNKKRDALNNYIQSLRFSKYEDMKDDVVYYEISGIFKTMDGGIYFKGYIDSLEQAYIFNKNNYQYSRELGLALFRTEEKKKAAYHLERFVDLSGEKPDPEIYLKLASLFETIKKYMEAEKYYNEYLRYKPEEGAVHYSLGYLAYFHTGNYTLAESSFGAALRLLREDDLYRRSKSLEYLADMSFSNLKYKKSIELYQNGIKYQGMIQERLDQKKKELAGVKLKINEMKSEVIYKQDFNNFEEFEMLQDDQGKIETEINNLNYQLRNMNPGKIRWNIAEIYTKTGNYEEAIKYYREAVHFNYNANLSREMITKLQLKIRRGY